MKRSRNGTSSVAGDPRYGDAADSLVAIAIVLHELGDLLDDERLHRDAA